MGSQAAVTAETDQRLLSPNSTGLPDLELFRACFSRLPDLVIVTDMQSNLLFLNDSAQTVTGCKPTDGSRLICSDILRCRQNEQLSLIEECLNRGTLDKFQVDVRNYEGDWVSYLVSAQLANDSRGKPTGCVFILRSDPSLANGLQERVLDHHIFTSVIDHFPMPFFTVDTNLTITYMNEHLEKLTGYCRSEVVNRMRCSEVLRTAHCDTDDCLLKLAMEKRTPVAGVRRVIHDREGRGIPIAGHCSMITDSANRVIGGFKALRDITPLV